MRWSVLVLFAAALLVAAVAVPAQAECGFFYKIGAACQPDNSIRIHWSAAINGSCEDVTISLERKCGNSAWVTIADPATSPYDDPPAPNPCAVGWTYRLKMTCVCNGQLVENYSAEMGPIHCP